VAGKLFGILGSKKGEEVAPHSGPLNESDLQQWLASRIARAAKLDSDQVDVNRSFAEFGLDSMQLFELSSDLEKFLGRKVPEVVAWDYPTIALLAEHFSNPEKAVPIGTMTMLPDEGNW
jgi:acyl carrier protein